MAVSENSVHLDWDKIKANRINWILVYSAGILLSLIYNIWIFSGIFGGVSFEDKLYIGIFSFSVYGGWGLVFGFASGVVTYKSDFTEQLVVTFIAAYSAYLLIAIVYLFFDAVVQVVFVLMITLFIGFGIGFGTNHILIRKLMKIKEKV